MVLRCHQFSIIIIIIIIIIYLFIYSIFLCGVAVILNRTVCDVSAFKPTVLRRETK